jgi:hypothetical protein
MEKGRQSQMQHMETLMLDGTLDVRHRLHNLVIWEEAAQAQIRQLNEQIAAINVANKRALHQADELGARRRLLNSLRLPAPLELDPHIVEMLGYQDLRRHLVNQFNPLSVDERLLWLHNLSFLLTPDLRQLTNMLVRVQEQSLQGQQRNILFVGASGMGKTAYLSWLTAFQFLPRAEEENLPPSIINIDAPVTQNPRRLLQRMLQASGISYSKGDSEELLMQLALRFRKGGIGALTVDEMHHLDVLAASLLLSELSHLIDPVPLIGVVCDPIRWMKANGQLADPFGLSFELKPYTGKRLQQFLSLINLILPLPQESFGGSCPYDQSNLDSTPDPFLSQEGYFIQVATRGILRDMMRLIIKASEEAIRVGLSYLGLDLLQHTWQQFVLQ